MELIAFMREYNIANLDSELQSPWKQRRHEFVGAADIPVQGDI